MGEYRTARMALERALKFRPDQFEAAVTLGELNLDLGNTRRGAEVLEMAARLRPREFGVWRLLGHALNDTNDHAGAEQAYQKALEVRPNDRDVLTALITVLVKSGQSDRRLALDQPGVRAPPRRPAGIGLRGPGGPGNPSHQRIPGARRSRLAAGSAGP